MTSTPTLAPSGTRPGLIVNDLSVHFGGNKAVQNISLQAPVGIVTGLDRAQRRRQDHDLQRLHGFSPPDDRSGVALRSRGDR